MTNLNVIVAFKADHIDQLKQALQSVDDLSQLNQRIHQSDGILKSWAERCGGRAISIEAGSGVLEVTADHLTELYSLKDQYKQELGVSVSVGVGKQLADAQKALQLANKSGGDKIELYTDDTESSLKELESRVTKSESLAEILLKADEGPALNKPAAGGGMTGPSEAAPAGPQAPVEEGSEHSQNEAYQSFMDSQPPAAEPPDMMGEFSQLAQESEGREQGEKEQQVQAQQQQEGMDGMKKELVEVLKEFQQLGPLWEELKQAQPEAHKVLEAMMQSMVKLARLAFADGQEEQPQEEQQVQKSEDLMPGGKGDNVSDAEFDLEQLAVGIATEMEEHGLDRKRAKEIAKDHLTEDPNYYREAMEKVAHALEAGKTGRHQVVLPVGSQLDSGQHASRNVGRVKIQSPSTGKTKWRQVRAGQVMDPEGNPTSSRNPSGGVDKK